MATNFPATGIDSYTTKVDGSDYPQASHINNPQDAIVALQTKVGVDGSAVATSLDYLVKNTTGGHDHDGSDSKKVIATNLDVTGLTASQLLRVNSGASAVESSGKTVPTGDIVGTTDEQTLTNKTLTMPIINGVAGTILNSIYPVGSIYMNVAVATNPGTLLGFGTWTAFGAGRVPVGYNASDSDFNAALKEGGAKTHTLSTAELPAHGHTFSATTGVESATHTHYDAGHQHAMGITDSDQDGSGSNGAITGSKNTGTGYASLGTQSANHTHTVSGTTANAGSGNAHNNLQPYVVVYMWRRVS